MIIRHAGELAELLEQLALLARAGHLAKVMVVWVDGWGRAAVEFTPPERSLPDVDDEPPTPPLGARRRH